MDKPIFGSGIAIAILSTYLLVDSLIFYSGFTVNILLDAALVFFGIAAARFAWKYKEDKNDEKTQGDAARDPVSTDPEPGADEPVKETETDNPEVIE